MFFFFFYHYALIVILSSNTRRNNIFEFKFINEHLNEYTRNFFLLQAKRQYFIIILFLFFPALCAHNIN